MNGLTFEDEVGELSNERKYPLTRAALLAAGVPERYWDAALSKMKSSPFKKKLGQYLVNVHKMAKQGKGLYLCGGFGVGKTAAAVAMLKEVLRRGGSAYFLKMKHLLRAMYEDEETADGMGLIKYLIPTVDLLVLDNLGAEGFDPKKSGGAELEGVVEDRYQRKRMVIVTSNLNPKALETHYTVAFRNVLWRAVSVVTLKTEQWKGK